MITNEEREKARILLGCTQQDDLYFEKMRARTGVIEAAFNLIESTSTVEAYALYSTKHHSYIEIRDEPIEVDSVYDKALEVAVIPRKEYEALKVALSNIVTYNDKVAALAALKGGA